MLDWSRHATAIAHYLSNLLLGLAHSLAVNVEGVSALARAHLRSASIGGERHRDVKALFKTVLDQAAKLLAEIVHVGPSKACSLGAYAHLVECSGRLMYDVVPIRLLLVVRLVLVGR